jgi:hypothetical protein
LLFRSFTRSSKLSDPARGCIHGVDKFNKLVICVGQDFSTLNGIITVYSAHNGFGDLIA